ncbi:hypothetical protein [Bradyrhizobium sp. STM 3809]|uniref:hypothetical protein n=1 Tax=Bradyrhizobium sp. STM 3809 TaxID=551936 RepID=UPI0002EAB6D2|nr:hypothetical protein [Bradyrhizobium sp. STM 3809]
MKAAEWTATARPASVATGGTEKSLPGPLAHAPGRQQARDVAGVGDALDACSCEAGRRPAQAGQQTFEIDNERARPAKTESWH